MKELATVTSKRQLTIPIKIFKAAKMLDKQKVLISQEGASLVITPTVDMVESLAGSLKIPPRWKGKGIDTIVEEAKHDYFTKNPNK